MSSLYVRQLTREWIAQAVQAALPSTPLPFYDTVNRDSDPPDEHWITAQFLGGINEPSTYCSDVERGSFDLMFFTRAGAGDVPLLTLAEPVVAEFMRQRDPTRRLQLLRVGPPEDFPAGGGVPWWIASFPVDYTFAH